MSAAAVADGALATAAGAGGAALLRLAWRRPHPAAPTLAGWTLMALAVVGWRSCAAWDKAVALAALAPALTGLALVSAHAEVRPARGSRVRARMAAELPDRSGERSWQGWARALLGGPLAGAAALALAAAWALRGPGSPSDRTAAALLLAPTLWGLALVWALTDAQLLRIGGGLVALSLLGVAAARGL